MLLSAKSVRPPQKCQRVKAEEVVSFPLKCKVLADIALVVPNNVNKHSSPLHCLIHDKKTREHHLFSTYQPSQKKDFHVLIS